MSLERSDWIIRTLKEQDLPRLVKIDHQITGRSRQLWYEGKLRRALRDTDVQISLGAERDGVLAGALLASLHYGEFGVPEPVAVLDTMLVDRSFARQGVASALLEQLVKNLRGLRIEQVRTEVAWDQQELLSFFKDAGFAPLPRLVLSLDVNRFSERPPKGE
ncbi:MAG: GNAT family N-acetyltransferase [Deltaproteobacteria bacterium]|nr:GNAT family N-acetyltransferase [Deltaproteobacteria bacterium]